MNTFKHHKFKVFLTTLFVFFPFWSWAASHITVIVPVRHASLDKIVQGIEHALVDKDITIDVKNAQGDNTLLMSLLQQVKYSKTDLVVAIGTSTAQIALWQLKKIPVFAVAAHFETPPPQFVGILDDEVMSISWIHHFHDCFPLAVIASANEKVMLEIEALKAYAHENKLSLYLATIQQLHELPLLLKSLPEKIKGILILKDHVAVSGVSLIAQEANKRHIPLIASDQGSVIQGATLAVAVDEEKFGEEAGALIQKILADKNKKAIGNQYVDDIELFFNKKSLIYQDVLTKERLCSLSMTCVEVAQ